MTKFINKKCILRSWLSMIILFVFTVSSIIPTSYAYAQSSVLDLPVPGTMIGLSQGFTPAIIRGITIDPKNPLEFNFYVDKGDSSLSENKLNHEAKKLVKYFLASLTTPEKDLWVNLSPYEKDRIIPKGFDETEMGRDLLAQDYILKQITSSLMYPESELGAEFWDKVYSEIYRRYTPDVLSGDKSRDSDLSKALSVGAVNTFNKVWIVPEKAVVYEHGTSAFVVESKLKVMLEEDYVAFNEGRRTKDEGRLTKEEGRRMKGENNESSAVSHLSSLVIKEIIIPALEKEVNEGRNFAPLRQVYNSLILATWYKMNLKESFLSKVYVDKNKNKGIDVQDKEIKQKIFEQYIESFKKGVYNYIKEDYDPLSQQIIPRKYFSGGEEFALTSKILVKTEDKDLAMIALKQENDIFDFRVQLANEIDTAMVNQPNRVNPYDESGQEISALLRSNPTKKYLSLEKAKELGLVGSRSRYFMAGINRDLRFRFYLKGVEKPTKKRAVEIVPFNENKIYQFLEKFSEQIAEDTESFRDFIPEYENLRQREDKKSILFSEIKNLKDLNKTSLFDQVSEAGKNIESKIIALSKSVKDLEWKEAVAVEQTLNDYLINKMTFVTIFGFLKPELSDEDLTLFDHAVEYLNEFLERLDNIKRVVRFLKDSSTQNNYADYFVFYDREESVSMRQLDLQTILKMEEIRKHPSLSEEAKTAETKILKKVRENLKERKLSKSQAQAMGLFSQKNFLNNVISEINNDLRFPYFLRMNTQGPTLTMQKETSLTIEEITPETIKETMGEPLQEYEEKLVVLQDIVTSISQGQFETSRIQDAENIVAYLKKALNQHGLQEEIAGKDIDSRELKERFLTRIVLVEQINNILLGSFDFYFDAIKTQEDRDKEYSKRIDDSIERSLDVVRRLRNLKEVKIKVDAGTPFLDFAMVAFDKGKAVNDLVELFKNNPGQNSLSLERAKAFGLADENGFIQENIDKLNSTLSFRRYLRIDNNRLYSEPLDLNTIRTEFQRRVDEKLKNTLKDSDQKMLKQQGLGQYLEKSLADIIGDLGKIAHKYSELTKAEQGADLFKDVNDIEKLFRLVFTPYAIIDKRNIISDSKQKGALLAEGTLAHYINNKFGGFYQYAQLENLKRESNDEYILNTLKNNITNMVSSYDDLFSILDELKNLKEFDITDTTNNGVIDVGGFDEADKDSEIFDAERYKDVGRYLLNFIEHEKGADLSPGRSFYDQIKSYDIPDNPDDILLDLEEAKVFGLVKDGLFNIDIIDRINRSFEFGYYIDTQSYKKLGKIAIKQLSEAGIRNQVKEHAFLKDSFEGLVEVIDTAIEKDDQYIKQKIGRSINLIRSNFSDKFDYNFIQEGIKNIDSKTAKESMIVDATISHYFNNSGIFGFFELLMFRKDSKEKEELPTIFKIREAAQRMVDILEYLENSENLQIGDAMGEYALIVPSFTGDQNKEKSNDRAMISYEDGNVLRKFQYDAEKNRSTVIKVLPGGEVETTFYKGDVQNTWVKLMAAQRMLKDIYLPKNNLGDEKLLEMGNMISGYKKAIFMWRHNRADKEILPKDFIEKREMDPVFQEILDYAKTFADYYSQEAGPWNVGWDFSNETKEGFVSFIGLGLSNLASKKDSSNKNIEEVFEKIKTALTGQVQVMSALLEHDSDNAMLSDSQKNISELKDAIPLAMKMLRVKDFLRQVGDLKTYDKIVVVMNKDNTVTEPNEPVTTAMLKEIVELFKNDVKVVIITGGALEYSNEYLIRPIEKALKMEGLADKLKNFTYYLLSGVGKITWNEQGERNEVEYSDQKFSEREKIEVFRAFAVSFIEEVIAMKGLGVDAENAKGFLNLIKGVNKKTSELAEMSEIDSIIGLFDKFLFKNKDKLGFVKLKNGNDRKLILEYKESRDKQATEAFRNIESVRRIVDRIQKNQRINGKKDIDSPSVVNISKYKLNYGETYIELALIDKEEAFKKMQSKMKLQQNKTLFINIGDSSNDFGFLKDEGKASYKGMQLSYYVGNNSEGLSENVKVYEKKGPEGTGEILGVVNSAIADKAMTGDGLKPSDIKNAVLKKMEGFLQIDYQNTKAENIFKDILAITNAYPESLDLKVFEPLLDKIKNEKINFAKEGKGTSLEERNKREKFVLDVMLLKELLKKTDGLTFFNVLVILGDSIRGFEENGEGQRAVYLKSRLYQHEILGNYFSRPYPFKVALEKAILYFSGNSYLTDINDFKYSEDFDYPNNFDVILRILEKYDGQFVVDVLTEFLALDNRRESQSSKKIISILKENTNDYSEVIYLVKRLIDSIKLAQGDAFYSIKDLLTEISSESKPVVLEKNKGLLRYNPYHIVIGQLEKHWISEHKTGHLRDEVAGRYAEVRKALQANYKKKRKDEAMTIEGKKDFSVNENEVPGGIDLDPQKMGLEIKKDGKNVPLPIWEQPVDDLNIEGFVPVIINVTPAVNLPLLLGLENADKPAKTAKLI